MDKRPDVAFGKYDPALFDNTGKSLLVNEIFYSIQGEGAYAGLAAVFVRLAKCNLKCAFCDTEFERGELLTVGEIMRRIQASIHAECAESVTRAEKPVIILTGGEPALQNCAPLVHELHEVEGAEVHVETSGSVWNDWLDDADYITISPKVLKHAIPERLRKIVQGFGRGQMKWIVNQSFNTLYDRDIDSVYMPDVPNCLQPESQKPEWTARAIELVKRHPDRYTLSMQMHKYAGVL